MDKGQKPKDNPQRLKGSISEALRKLEAAIKQHKELAEGAKKWK